MSTSISPSLHQLYNNFSSTTPGSPHQCGVSTLYDDRHTDLANQSCVCTASPHITFMHIVYSELHKHLCRTEIKSKVCTKNFITPYTCLLYIAWANQRRGQCCIPRTKFSLPIQHRSKNYSGRQRSYAPRTVSQYNKLVKAW